MVFSRTCHRLRIAKYSLQKLATLFVGGKKKALFIRPDIHQATWTTFVWWHKYYIQNKQESFSACFVTFSRLTQVLVVDLSRENMANGFFAATQSLLMSVILLINCPWYGGLGVSVGLVWILGGSVTNILIRDYVIKDWL